VPSVHIMARLVGIGRDHLTKADTLTVAAVERRTADVANGFASCVPLRPPVAG
jgi:hypothetical protein